MESNINELLNKPLDKKNVANRSNGGFDLSYIESHHAIREMNRIFNFDWSSETVYCKEVCRYEYNGKQKVGYEAMVRVTVAGLTKEGTGHGSGIAKDLFDAIEGAGKEAESDAQKRALRMLGDQFGLALYDKQQTHVEDVAQKEDARNKANGWVDAQITLLGFDDVDIAGWEADNAKHLDKLAKTYSDLHLKLAEFVAKRKGK